MKMMGSRSGNVYSTETMSVDISADNSRKEAKTHPRDWERSWIPSSCWPEERRCGHRQSLQFGSRVNGSTVVALSKGIMHPNVLRLLGMSSPESLSHFIVYENTHRQNAEGPLAVALKNDLEKSIRLGFKMIAGLSAGMNHLSVHGLSLGSMRVENFDIFLDVDDRFVICPHPPSLVEGDTAQEQEESAWAVFNALCQKTLMSANRVLHHDEIKRDSAILDVIESMSAEIPGESLLPSRPASSSSSKNTQEDELGIPPRREYVWRTIDRGRQSLETVASRIALDLDMDLSSLRRMTSRDGRSPHRCAGYVREEITLATTTFHSAVVAHNAPSPSELCPICHEVVGPQEKF
ncbi:hypothetical protein B0H14DRAFT_1142947 [Mycena olivaceomarginata]|nr:hypothetical protein B0H14DRAFT_1142947 [Mycena olivaceomarginata]